MASHPFKDTLAAAARLLADLWTEDRAQAVESRAAARLPWTRFLPTPERHAFVREFLEQFEACADLGDFSALGRLLAEWKGSAAVHAEGLAAELKRPVVRLGERVRRPGR